MSSAEAVCLPRRQGPRPISLKRVEVFSFVLGLGVNSGLLWGHPGARCFLHWGGAMHTCVRFLGDVRSRSILDSKGADIDGGLCDVVCSDGTGLPTLRPRARGAVGWGRALFSPCSSGAAMCPVNKLLCFLPGRMFIFYGNKTSTQFLNFTPTLICSDDLQANILGPVAPRAKGRVGGRIDSEDSPGAGPAVSGSDSCQAVHP